MRISDLIFFISGNDSEVRGNISIHIREYFLKLFKVAQTQNAHVKYKLHKEIIFATEVKEPRFSLANIVYLMIKIDDSKPFILRLDYNDNIHLWEVDREYITSNPYFQWENIKKFHHNNYKILEIEK